MPSPLILRIKKLRERGVRVAVYPKHSSVASIFLPDGGGWILRELLLPISQESCIVSPLMGILEEAEGEGEVFAVGIGDVEAIYITLQEGREYFIEHSARKKKTKVAVTKEDLRIVGELDKCTGCRDLLEDFVLLFDKANRSFKYTPNITILEDAKSGFIRVFGDPLSLGFKNGSLVWMEITFDPALNTLKEGVNKRILELVGILRSLQAETVSVDYYKKQIRVHGRDYRFSLKIKGKKAGVYLSGEAPLGLIEAMSRVFPGVRVPDLEVLLKLSPDEFFGWLRVE